MIKSIEQLLPDKDIQLEIIQTISKVYYDIKFEFTEEFGSTLEISYDNFDILQLENKKIKVTVEIDEFDIIDNIRLQRKIYTIFNSLFNCINTYCKDNQIAQGSLHKVYISTFYDTFLTVLEKNNKTYIEGYIHIFV